MQSDAPGPDNGPGRLAPVRILVLYDEPMIRYFIGRTLEEEGLRGRNAHSRLSAHSNSCPRRASI